ncbi:transporter [Flavobacterium sp. SM15]|uniref:transporter n=1 Tax=Flavobacterium sp. SM15 TaxID=2908005 RepID=UPI001EDAD1BF|nr:transporter [Flavobacterium sp. SM15]MCG2611116.1 transporter [Flavobacterium sp. SM15]
MKKNYLVLVLLIGFQLASASVIDSTAFVNPFKKHFFLLEDDCDACGCSASGGSMGFSSMLNSNFIGIRYFNQRYRSNDKLYTNSVWHDENFNTIQLWARIPVVKNVQVSVLAPYHFNSRKTFAESQLISGLGDITFIGMYRLYQTHKDSTVFVHTLQLGGGIKAPTGKFDAANNGSVNPSFQLGTGSWDYLLTLEYVIKHKKIGLNTMLNYIIKTENEKKYRFGNQTNYAVTLFYLWEKNEYSVAPQLGLAGEVYAFNYQYGEKVRNTNGDVIFGKFGFEIGRDKLSFGANAMLPINQNLTGGRVEASYRWSLHLNYSL